MASTLSICIEYALDMCPKALALPSKLHDQLMSLESGKDPRVWTVLQGIVQHNLFPVIEACVRDGLDFSTATDVQGRNALFYATFALKTAAFLPWIKYFTLRGARPMADANGRGLRQYVLKYVGVYNLNDEETEAALQVLQRIRV